MLQEFLGATNFAGRDGFYWWMGQVETQKGGQAKSDDRYKVRIVGQHLKDCNAVAYEDLPWAIVMMPATAPRREGGTNFQSVEYKSGDWVIGFFMDGRDGQQPIIMGSIGQQYKASTTHTGKEKPADACLAFTTFLDPDVNINAAAPATQADAVKSGGVDGTNPPANGNTAGEKPDLNQPPNVSNEAASKLLLGTKCCNSETNPAGEYFCTEISDAKCESSDNDKSKFQSVLSDLFANIQNNGGQFGTTIVGKYTGKLYDYIGIAQGYVNKSLRLASSIVARVKGEMFAFIKQGARAIIDFLLTEEVVDPASPGTFVGPYANPDEAVKPAKKRVGRLRGLTAWINKQLKNVNCVMEDLDKRLMAFIEELIFGALEQVFNAARCFIDDLVGDIFNQIAKFLEDAISLILGPLQQLLSIIANPLDILGAAIKQIFDLLGITCGGANNNCVATEQLKNCTGPCGEKEGDFLDDLLAAIEQGNLDNSTGNCAASRTSPPVTPTTAFPIGGTPNPPTYTGTIPTVLPPEDPLDPTLNPTIFYGPIEGCTDSTATNYNSSAVVDDGSCVFSSTTPIEGCTDSTAVNYNPYAVVDNGSCTYSKTTTPPPIQPPIVNPPGTLTPPTNTPTLVIIGGALVDISDIGDLILTISGGMSSSQFYKAQTQTNNLSFNNTLLKLTLGGEATTSAELISTDVTEGLTYTLTANKLVVFEGDSITFTLVANNVNVTDGTIFNYAMFGDITQDDFSDKKTIGTMTMFNNIASKTITIADDALEEGIESVTFNVKEAVKSVIFSIAASDSVTTSPEPPSPTQPAFNPPVFGSPEVCSDGRIMEIPIIFRGDAYLTPPIVIIRGAGFGAAAKVALNEEGYIDKVIVQRSGAGYAPSRSRQNCVVSNFLMLTPGAGYYRNPTVYVDGKSNVAKAVIDSDGFVSGIEVIDKTKTFSCTPKVEVFGGNGLGAKAIAIMECRDDATFSRFAEEVAPSGVDSVIDCP